MHRFFHAFPINTVLLLAAPTLLPSGHPMGSEVCRRADLPLMPLSQRPADRQSRRLLQAIDLGWTIETALTAPLQLLVCYHRSRRCQNFLVGSSHSSSVFRS